MDLGTINPAEYIIAAVGFLVTLVVNQARADIKGLREKTENLTVRVAILEALNAAERSD